MPLRRIVGLAANISSVPEPPAPSSDSTGYIINNTMFLTLEEFQDATQFPLSRFFASAPIVTRVASVFTPYIGHILDEYMMAPLDAVKATVLFQYLMDTVAFLPESVQSAALPVVEAGAVAPGLYQDRSNLCLQTVISTFNNMLTHEFVLEDFPKGNKAAATDLVNRIWTALGGDLETVPWADAATKAMLHTKWTDIKKNIGYYRCGAARALFFLACVCVCLCLLLSFPASRHAGGCCVCAQHVERRPALGLPAGQWQLCGHGQVRRMSHVVV